MHAYLQRLQSRVLVILLAQGVKTFIVSAFILLLFQWLVGRHLAALAGHLSRARSHPADAQLVLSRAPRVGAHDELDAVVQSLNAMQLRQGTLLQALQTSEARLASVLDNMADAAQSPIPKKCWAICKHVFVPWHFCTNRSIAPTDWPQLTWGVT